MLFNGLNNRVRTILHQLETLRVMIINRMYPHYRVTVPTGASGRERLNPAVPRAIRAGEG